MKLKGFSNTEALVSTLENLNSKTSISDLTLSQDSLNVEVERAFASNSPCLTEKRDSGNHTQTTEFETTTTDDSEDEFEALRARQRLLREAAPPERDIFEDDTETADFQLKLRHLNGPQESTETINNEVKESKEDTEPELGDILNNFPIRQSRSFDSGLPHAVPELKLLKQKSTSVRHLSSSSINSLRKSSNTTPSPRKQSIEDLASSVENLKEKLLLIPKDSAETIQVVKERLARNPQKTPNNQNIIRSRSWQGFSAAHRTSRQQAFWESQRYESTSEKDLSLPPVPDKVPDIVSTRRHKSPSRYSRRRYRPLSQSPSSSPARHIRLRSTSLPESGGGGGSLERLPRKSTSSQGGANIEKVSSTERKSRGAEQQWESEPESESESEAEDDEDFFNCIVYNMDQQNLKPNEESNEDSEEVEVEKRPNKSANNYFYRHHYLSIIQEENEENSEMSPSTSRNSSRPGSIYIPNSPKRSPKMAVRDSLGSEFSVDSINSILSEESCKTYSSNEVNTALENFLENVPPPPPAEQKQDIAILTNALEKQLSEIEKTVSEKRKSKDQGPTKPQSNPFSSNPSKFGNSMREMLKSVVSSQKNVLHKKVESIEEKSGKMGKFFKKKNPLSKSQQSLDTHQSKESLNSNSSENHSSRMNQDNNPKSRRSKSLSCESRATTTTGTVKARANNTNEGQQGNSANQAKSRWLGKNPFETDKSPTTEVLYQI